MSVPQKGRRPQQKCNAVRIAVSACLLGHKVRYDGGDKKNSILRSRLAKVAQLLPVCPEVEIGMGVPRPPIHVVEINGVALLKGRFIAFIHIDQADMRYSRFQVKIGRRVS